MTNFFTTLALLSTMLLFEVCAEYRFKEATQLTILPQQMVFMNDQLVLRQGISVEVRSGGDYSSLVRAFTIPSKQSQVSVVPSLQEIIFSTQNGISKSVKTTQNNMSLAMDNKFSQYWNSFLEITSDRDLFIIPPISFSKQISIINSTDLTLSHLSTQGNYSTIFELKSQLIATDEAYYFANGLSYSDSTPQQQYLYFYQGTNNTYKNVFNFTAQRTTYQLTDSPRQYLQINQEDNVSYFFIAKQNTYSSFVCEIAAKEGENYLSLGVSLPIQAKTLRLVNNEKLVYLNYFCSVMQNYSSQWLINLPKGSSIDRMLDIVSSYNSKTLIGFSRFSTTFQFNNTYAKASLFKLDQNQSYHQIGPFPRNKGGFNFKGCTFFNSSQYIAVHEGTYVPGYSQLSFYSIDRQAYIEAFLYEVDDYSICPNSNHLYIRTNQTIMLYILENDTITQLASVTQPYKRTLNFTCGWNNEIFIIFNTEPYLFQKWSLINGSLTKIASKFRDKDSWDTIVAVFEDALILKDQRIGIYFFDYNLNMFHVPFDQYDKRNLRVIETKGNLIIFSNRYTDSQSYSVLYQYSNRNLIYKGNYPTRIKDYPVVRRIILPDSRELYIDYYSSASQNFESVKFKLDKAPQLRKGQIYDSQYNESCEFISPIITQSLDVIAITEESFKLNKYSLSKENKLIDSVALSSFKTIDKFKLSNSEKYICVWGKSINQPNNNYIQGRLYSDFNTIIFKKQLKDLSKGQNILDCVINDLQITAIITFIKNSFVNLYLFDDRLKELKVESTLSSVTGIAVCQEYGSYAYTGIDLETTLPSSYIFIDSPKAQNSSTIFTGCEVKLISYSKDCNSIVYVCADDNVIVYNIASKTTYFNKSFSQTINKIQIISSTKLLITTQTSITIVDYQQSSIFKIKDSSLASVAPNNSIAVNYGSQLIAYSSDIKTITIIDFSGNVVDSLTNKDNLDVVALVFKSSGELFASFNGKTANSVSSIVVWIDEPCPPTQILKNSYCVCQDTYHLVNNSCICINNQIIVDGFCSCPNNLSLINDYCRCKNNLIIKDNFCVCQNNLVVLNDSCGCWSNLVLKDGFCKCLNNLILINDTCDCPNNLSLIENFCKCKNNLVIKNDFCVCQNNLILLNESCGCPNNLSLINDFCGCRNNLVVKNDYCVCLNNLILLNDSCGCESNLVIKDSYCKCPSNLILVNSTCTCPSRFELRVGKCKCRGDLSIIEDKCQCSSGFAELDNFICEKCAFTCSECQDGGLFSCTVFGAWLYVISGAILLVIGVIVVIVIKIRRRKRLQSQLQTNLSESKQGGLLSQQNQ